MWRAPPGYNGRIADRDGGPPVDWLSATLAAVEGAPAPAGKQRMDAALSSRVLAFQIAQGIPADGRPGPMTFMQLNRAAGVDEPKLQTGP